MLTRGLLTPGRSSHYVRYALVGQRRVEGWLEDLGLALIDVADDIQRRANVRGPVAEIGVHHGRLFILLSLLRGPDESAVAIDLFEDQHLNVDSSGKGDRVRFEHNLRRWDPRRDSVEIVKADSWSLNGQRLRELAGGPLRLVSVDGGHTAELTEHDLTTACDALTDGGIVILDDCFNDYFPSVAEGAQTFFRGREDVVPFIVGGNKTLICHAGRAESFREEFLERLTRHPANIEERTFLGRPIVAAQPLQGRYVRDYWRRYTYARLQSVLHR